MRKIAPLSMRLFVGTLFLTIVNATAQPVSFSNVGGTTGVANSGFSIGGAWGDYDNDGHLDLYVWNIFSPNQLYHNSGNGSFTLGSGVLSDGSFSAGAAWGDYDNDGDLDLYVANSDAANRLYRNDSNGSFSERAVSAGVAATTGSTSSNAGTWLDYNNDGFIDLYIATTNGANYLYSNDGDGTFTDRTNSAGVGDISHARGIPWGDYDNDGDMDIYIANSGVNRLYRNNGDGTFTDIASGAGVAHGGDGSGAMFGDYDNDGDLDLYLASNGDVFYENEGNGTFSTSNKIIGNGQVGRGATWSDYDSDGDLDLFVARSTGANELFRNDGASFSETSSSVNISNVGDAYHGAWGDYDNDGYLDLYVATSSTNALFKNGGNGNHWLQVQPVGTTNTKDGIGAEVWVVSGSQKQRRTKGSYSSYLGQGTLPVWFGLGNTALIDSVIVQWPSGSSRVLTNVNSDQVLTVVEVATVGISIPDVQTPYSSILQIPVEVTDTSGKGIVSAEIFIAYDGDLITAFSPGLTGTLATGWSLESNIVQGNGTNIDTIKIAMATDDDVLSGAGTLVNLSFQVADVRVPSSTTLELKHVLFNDGIPTNTTTDGSLTITGNDAVATLSVTSVIPRESITFTISDIDEDLDGVGSTDQLTATVSNGGQTETLTLNETSTPGEFTGTISTIFSASSTSALHSGDGTVQAQAGDQLSFDTVDQLLGDGSGPGAIHGLVDVIGGADGSISVTLVSQPGDPLYIQITDADLNASFSAAETASVTVSNSRTLESFTVVLTEADLDDEVFFGSLATTPGASTATEMETAEDDVLTVTYDDVVTASGDQTDRMAVDDVIFPWGDADDNESLQAFDAARVLLHVLLPGSNPIDEQAANVDIDPVGTGISPFDASLILQKRVGLIASFPVQDPTSTNHPQGTPASKRIADQRVLSLAVGEGYISVMADERDGLLSGDLTLKGVAGRVEMGPELSSYLLASRPIEQGQRIVFAGAEAVSGPGELLRVYGATEDDVSLMEAAFNDGAIEGNGLGLTLQAAPPAFALHPNTPNPFNPETTIRFALPQTADVELVIYDALGQKVRTLVAAQLSAGVHALRWNGRNEAGIQVGNGVYFYRLQAGAFSQVKRMLLLK